MKSFDERTDKNDWADRLEQEQLAIKQSHYALERIFAIAASRPSLIDAIRNSNDLARLYNDMLTIYVIADAVLHGK